MKKSGLKIVLSIFTFFAVYLSGYADTNIGSDGKPLNNSCTSRVNAHCYNASLNYMNVGEEVNAIRITVVDQNGNRISASEDYINSTYMRNKFNILMNSKNVYVLGSSKRTKNEVVASQNTQSMAFSKNFGFSEIILGFNDFVGTGANNYVSNYFESKDNLSTIKSVYNEIGYDYAKYTLEERNLHSLLIEPIMFLTYREFDANSVMTMHHFAGTATEVYAMIKAKDLRGYSTTGYFSEIKGVYSLALYTNSYYDSEGILQNQRAGLRAITSSTTDLSAKMLTTFGTAAGHIWVKDTFDDGGGDPKTCEITSACTSNCDNPGGGVIADTSEWRCLFATKKTEDSRIKKEENRYCQIACREEISLIYPGKDTLVTAGSHFTIGGTGIVNNWGPINVTGTRECRTTGPLNSSSDYIDWSGFVSDYQTANIKVVNAWDAYQIERNRLASINGATKSSSACDWEYNLSSSTAWSSGSTYTTTKSSGSLPNATATSPSLVTITQYSFVSSQTTETGTTYTYKSRTSTYNKSVVGYTMLAKSSYYKGIDRKVSNWCSSSSPASTNVSSKYSNYTNEVRARSALLSDINECNNLEDNYNNLDPKLELKYDAPSGPNYGGTFPLEYTSNTENKEYYGVKTSTSESIDSYKDAGTIISYDCGSSSNSISAQCTTKINVNYPKNDTYRLITRKANIFKLAGDTYRWVTKPAGISISSKPSGGNFIDIGYPNLPVHATTPAGNYDISLTLLSLGSDHSFNKEITSDDCSDYLCYYEVEKGIIVEKGQLLPIFRPVSLEEPFPGSLGSGRIPGANWTPNDIKDVIVNNRGVKGSEIYKLEPMYEVNLSQLDIIKIREYNRKANDGYADFNLVCEKETGNECRSSFIHDTFAHIFEQSKCGMNEDWDACNK